MSRRQAREAAMCLLYEREVAGEPGAETLTEMKDVLKTEKIIEDNGEYIKNILSVYDTEIDKIDEKLGLYCRGWKMDRLSKVDLSILRLAVIEMETGTPVRVAVNEAVELAKKYSTDKSPAFINGVLGSFTRNELPESE